MHLKRVPALDGLRGTAVVAVLLFHDDRLRGGYLGVDLFFVLSGFLITSLLLVEHRDHGHVRLARFYERRARRLLPAMVLALLFVAFYASVWATPLELPRLRWDGLATLFYVANWRDIAAKQSYWDIFTAPSALQHTWSLAIEEQFYAVWPVIVIAVLAMRRSARAVLAVALTIGGACAAFTVVAATRHGDSQLLYFGTPSRAPALLMGAALAAATVYWGPVPSGRARLALEVLAMCGIAYLAVEWSNQSGDGLALYRGPLLLCGVAATLVIAAAAHPEPGPIARVLAFKPLVGAGLISYGLYLFHWPIYLVLTPARTHWSGWALFALRVAASVAVALISYVLVEQPIRRGALRPMRAFVALTGATALVVGALVVSTVVPVVAVPAAVAQPRTTVPANWPRPTPAVVPGASVRSFLAPGDWGLLTNTCEVNRALPHVKPIGVIRQPKVLVIGDSVGCFVGSALDVQQITRGVVTLNRSKIGCPMIAAPHELFPDGTQAPHYDACIDGEQPAISAFDPDVVVLMVGGPMVRRYDLGDGKYVEPCTSSFTSWYDAGVRHAISVVSATGARVVVVSVVHPPKTFDIGPGVTVPVSYNRDVDCVNHDLRSVVAHDARARILDLDAYVCPHGDCLTKLHGVTLRNDGRHFQGTAANLIAAWMLPRVLTLGGVHTAPK